MNRFEGKRNEAHDRRTDYTDSPLYPLLKKLPQELAERHIELIEAHNLSDDEAQAYITKIIEARRDASTESHISDNELSTLSKFPKTEIFDRIERDVYKSPNIGFGTTAHIKRLDLIFDERALSLAVKYIVSPNSRTLSASAEHAMLAEMEHIQHIEEIETDMHLSHIKVPHPYFHHKNESLQCFGMELVNGVNLQEIIDGNVDEIRKEKLRDALTYIDVDAVVTEITQFFQRMHTYCLHGDIKPRNIMLDEHGKIYIIDFGQSVLKNSISEEAMDQFENLKEDEVRNAIAVYRIIRKKLNA